MLFKPVICRNNDLRNELRLKNKINWISKRDIPTQKKKRMVSCVKLYEWDVIRIRNAGKIVGSHGLDHLKIKPLFIPIESQINTSRF